MYYQLLYDGHSLFAMLSFRKVKIQVKSTPLESAEENPKFDFRKNKSLKQASNNKSFRRSLHKFAERET